jgi:trans-aconitate methyltransferase
MFAVVGTPTSDVQPSTQMHPFGRSPTHTHAPPTTLFRALSHLVPAAFVAVHLPRQAPLRSATAVRKTIRETIEEDDVQSETVDQVTTRATLHSAASTHVANNLAS